MTKSEIVVVLVNYNNHEVTRECLQSIGQHESVKPFIILVDNNSKDQNEIDHLKNYYRSLEIIKNEKNVGFGKANNIGIDWALSNIDFNYLILLNNDTVITENALSRLTKSFEKSNVGIVTGRIMYQYKPEYVWYGGGEINYKLGWPNITEIGEKPTRRGALTSKFVEFASGCLMVFSKESVLKIHGFDDRFFMYVEDLELSIRCQKFGLKIWYDAEVVIYHKVQGSFEGGEAFKGLHPKNPNVAFQFYERKKNQWITFRTHLKGWKFFRFFVFFMMKYKLDLLRLIIFSRKRIQVLKAHFKITNYILFHRFRK